MDFSEYAIRYRRLLESPAATILRLYNDHRRANGRNGDFLKTEWDDLNHQPLLDLITAVQDFQRSFDSWHVFDWPLIAGRFPDTLGKIVQLSRRGIRVCQDKWHEIARVTGIMTPAGLAPRPRSRSREKLTVHTPQRFLPHRLQVCDIGKTDVRQEVAGMPMWHGRGSRIDDTVALEFETRITRSPPPDHETEPFRLLSVFQTQSVLQIRSAIKSAPFLQGWEESDLRDGHDSALTDLIQFLKAAHESQHRTPLTDWMDVTDALPLVRAAANRFRGDLPLNQFLDKVITGIGRLLLSSPGGWS